MATPTGQLLVWHLWACMQPTAIIIARTELVVGALDESFDTARSLSPFGRLPVCGSSHATPTLFEVDRNALHVVVPHASTAASLDGQARRLAS